MEELPNWVIFVLILSWFMVWFLLWMLAWLWVKCEHKRQFRTTIRHYLEDDCQSIRDVYVCEKCKKVKKVKL